MTTMADRGIREIIVGALAVAWSSSAGFAQACPITVMRMAPSGLNGAYIRSVSVRTDAPVSLPVIGRWTANLRRRTEVRVVERQLLFSAGGTVDSARIGETLRRLRDQRLYSDVTLGVGRCTTGDTVDLTVGTVDAWTLRPIARVVPPSTVSLGVEDRNILGTARTISLTNDQTAHGHGGTVAASDPWLLGTDLAAAFRLSDVAGAHLLRASVRNHEYSVLDDWRLVAAVGRQSFRASTATPRPVVSNFIIVDLGRRIGQSSTSATTLYAGYEGDGSRVIVRGVSGVATEQRRGYSGLEVGWQRRTAQFDTASWFATGRGFVDVPIGPQFDVSTGVGTDRLQHAPAMRYDGWVGRMWMPRRGSLVTTDAWTSGFVGALRDNHIGRVAAAGFVEVPRGFAAARMTFEQLLALDPDLRLLSLSNISVDPSLGAVPTPVRDAKRMFAASGERSVHIRAVARASMLDAAVFAAGSVRWDSPTAPLEHFAVGVIGGRLRFFSANGSFTSTRIDLGYPIASNGSVVHRLLLSVSLNSLLDAPRQRDGRRRQQ